MNKVGSISVLHVIFLSMTVIGLKNHVTIIPSILKGAGRDGWISVIAADLLILPWFFFILYIHKQSNRAALTDWLTLTIGKTASTIFRYVTVVFLLILASFTMGETMQWIMATFLPETPLVFMLLIYTFICVWLVTTNIQTIVMVNVFVLFWVVVFGFFVAFTNIQVKDYTLLRPFLEHGLQPVLTSAAFPASGFVEILLFLFIQHKVKDRFRWYHFAAMLFIITGLTLGPLIGAITEFGPDEAAKQTYPAYEEWGLVSVGRFIEHVDFLSIYQWLTGALIRVGFILFVVADLLKITGDKKQIWKIIYPPFFLMTLSLFLMSDRVFLMIKGDYLLIFTLLFMFLLSLFLSIVAFITRKSSNKVET